MGIPIRAHQDFELLLLEAPSIYDCLVFVVLLLKRQPGTSISPTTFLIGASSDSAIAPVWTRERTTKARRVEARGFVSGPLTEAAGQPQDLPQRAAAPCPAAQTPGRLRSPTAEPPRHGAYRERTAPAAMG